MLRKRDVELELEKIESRLNGILALSKSGWTPATRHNATQHVTGVIEAMKVASIHIMRHYKEVMSPETLLTDLARVKIIPELQARDGDALIAATPGMSRMDNDDFREYMANASDLFSNYLRYVKKYLKDVVL